MTVTKITQKIKREIVSADLSLEDLLKNLISEKQFHIQKIEQKQQLRKEIQYKYFCFLWKNQSISTLNIKEEAL